MHTLILHSGDNILPNPNQHKNNMVAKFYMYLTTNFILKEIHHGAVDEPSLEQQFYNAMQLPLLCEKSEAIFLVLVGLRQVSRQAGS